MCVCVCVWHYSYSNIHENTKGEKSQCNLENLFSCKNLHANGYLSFIHNFSKSAAVKMSFSA